MEGDLILNFLVSLHPTVRLVLEWVALVAVVLVGVVALSPWKGDDAALEQVKKMPVVGALVAALLKFSPIKPKDE